MLFEKQPTIYWQRHSTYGYSRLYPYSTYTAVLVFTKYSQWTPARRARAAYSTLRLNTKYMQMCAKSSINYASGDSSIFERISPLNLQLGVHGRTRMPIRHRILDGVCTHSSTKGN
jgi:hypothetical protein